MHVVVEEEEDGGADLSEDELEDAEEMEAGLEDEVDAPEEQDEPEDDESDDDAAIARQFIQDKHGLNDGFFSIDEFSTSVTSGQRNSTHRG